MFPGITTKLSGTVVASAASIDPKSDMARVTGSTAIATIVPHGGGGFGTMIALVPVDGTVATLTTGNIAIAVTMPQNKATVFFYSKSTSKWYPCLSA